MNRRMTKSMQLPNKTPHTMDNANCTANNISKKKKKNKKKTKSNKIVTDFSAKTQADMVDAIMNHHVIRHGDHIENHHRSTKPSSSNTAKKSKEEDSFWSSTNNTEERQKIREFWLQLGEEERRSLVKVEKEAVLRKMKEQQKHSCNCSVCGKKRTAIEDELEVLYDAYYEELEQYANHQQQTRGNMNPLHASYLPSDPMYDNGYDDTDPLEDDEEDDDDDDEEEEDEEDIEDDIEEEDDDEEEEEEEDDDDEEEEEDEEDDEDFEDEEIVSRPPVNYGERSRFEEMAHIRHTALSRASAHGDHFSFGNSLTVKGGILTVADDLLKNDGKKFLDMMERLAERRMQKEDVTLEQGNNYFQEEEDEEDAFEDEDDEDTRTEEQRMEEGRRMFQIFAARMFEQRVLAAYREKVAQERQQRLLEELEEEARLREEREAKKQKEREKKKDKKRQLKQQQEAERLAREAKKKAEEEAAKRERAKKLEQERQKREQERLRKEEEKRQREEERLRKEEEKKRRAREEKERAAERERKRKEEKERLEKERLEKEKAQKEKERIEKEKAAKAKASPPLPPPPPSAPVESIPPVQAESTMKKSLPPGIIHPSHEEPENRQQVLIEALVGTSRPQPPVTIRTHPIAPPPPPPPPPFMPPTSLLSPSTTSPPQLHDPPMLGLFNNQRIEPSTSTRRSITPIAPIGQPLTGGRRMSSLPTTDNASIPESIAKRSSSIASPFDLTSTAMNGEPRSFFSSFLFGEPRTPNNTSLMSSLNDYDVRFAASPSTFADRRFSSDIAPNQSQNTWSNGWTASSLLSDNVHGKLFGDALPDRTAMTLERAKVAYQKLNEITQSNIFRGSQQQYHTLVQLHCMMIDLYCDFQVDIRELYDVLMASPSSGFQCLNHTQHGMVVLYDPTLTTTTTTNTTELPHHPLMHHPFSAPAPVPPPPNHPNIFGTMS